MKEWCNIDENYVYLKEHAAQVGDIWECDGEFVLIIDRGTKYGESDWRYKIHYLYPVIIKSEECKFRENRVFTFICVAEELEKFLSNQYIKANLHSFWTVIKERENERRN